MRVSSKGVEQTRPCQAWSKPQTPPASGSLKQEQQAFDGGDQMFSGLLRQLSELHQSKLRELRSVLAENERLCQAKNQGADVIVAGRTPLREAGESKDQIANMEVQSVGDREDQVEFFTTVVDANLEHKDRKCEADPSTRSQGSEEVFVLRDNWTQDISAKKVSLLQQSTTMLSRASSTTNDSGEERIAKYEGFLKPLISYPASRGRVAWDVAGAFLILWDLLIIPLNICTLAPEDSEFLMVMDWITLIFWTLNIFASLFVGYVKNGITIMHPLKILINYLKTWFVLDLIVVLPDWIFTLAQMVGDGDQSDAGSSVKLLRILRLVRCMRLLRLAKLRWIMASINDLINSEYTSIVANILKMILALVAINHFMGCMWFLIAELTSSGSNWVKFHGFEEAEWVYQYLVSFHWALTQFTPSSMHVQPQNIPERTFAITVVVFGLVGFSYLVGSITGSLTELRRMNSDTAKQFWNLRRYLNQNTVPTELSIRIQKYLEHQCQLRKVSVARENVTVLKFLSEQLNNELQCAIAVPNMLIHPLFDKLQFFSFVTMQRLATTAISRKPLASGDSLFYPLETATDMIFVVQGRLQYIRMVTKDLEWVDKQEDWISEPVLWTSHWRHRGQLIAAATCDLLLVSAASFAQIVSRSPQVHVFANNYAANFLAWINSVDRRELSDITQGDMVSDDIRTFMLTPEERRKSQGSKRSSDMTRKRLSRSFTNLAPDEVKHLFAA